MPAILQAMAFKTSDKHSNRNYSNDKLKDLLIK